MRRICLKNIQTRILITRAGLMYWWGFGDRQILRIRYLYQIPVASSASSGSNLARFLVPGSIPRLPAQGVGLVRLVCGGDEAGTVCLADLVVDRDDPTLRCSLCSNAAVGFDDRAVGCCSS